MVQALDALITDPRLFLERVEDQWFERKSIAAAPRDVARALVAFANAEGGTLALGVSRRDGLGGALANPRRINAIRQAALDLTEPAVRHTLHLVPCLNNRGDDDQIVVLEVEPSEQMHRLTDGSTWLRVGDETRELDFEQALQLGYDKGVSQFDREPALDATRDDLDLDAVGGYRERLGSRLAVDDLLDARGLTWARGDRAGATWAGLLTFGRSPGRFVPNAYVRLLRYEGLRAESGTRMNLAHDERLEGSIPAIIEQSRRAVPALFKRFTRLGPEGRFESLPEVEYPETAWLEAVVNALTHRSYTLQGDHIRLTVFDDRMEIESPGRLPGLVRPENIRTTRYSRNPYIARVLAELGYVRELGEGIDRMYAAMSAAGLPEPVFRQQAASVVVTLTNDWRERGRQARIDALPARLRPLLNLVTERGQVTSGDAAEVLGVARSTVIRQFRHLQDAGLVEQITSSANDPLAYWRPSR